MWAHVVWFCVCVCFLWRYFPLTQHKSTVNFLNTSHHHCTLTIHYLILPSTQPLPRFGNILLHHMKMVLRQMTQAPDLLSGKARLRTQGWSQRGCSGPLTCIFTQPWEPQTWSKGIPASTSMPRGISSSRGPDPAHHCKVASVVTEPRAPLGGLTLNFGTAICVKRTLEFTYCRSAYTFWALCGLM